MKFIQILDFHTTKFDEVQANRKAWEEATEGRRTAKRSIVTRDKNDPDHYIVAVFFDDYESAMENSNLPETGEFAAKQVALLDGPMQFLDLDVVEDTDMS